MMTRILFRYCGNLSMTLNHSIIKTSGNVGDKIWVVDELVAMVTSSMISLSSYE